MVGSVASPRTLGSVLLALIAVLLLVPPTTAAAVQSTEAAATDDHTTPTINEIGSGSKTAQGHLPEKSELPPFQRFLYVPLIVGGVLIIGLLLFRYLQWQPRFAEERRSKRRR